MELPNRPLRNGEVSHTKEENILKNILLFGVIPNIIFIILFMIIWYLIFGTLK